MQGGTNEGSVYAGCGLPDESSVVQPAFPARFAALALGECVPEPERLVSSTRDDRLSIGTHRKVEHTASVTRERHDHVQ